MLIDFQNMEESTKSTKREMDHQRAVNIAINEGHERYKKEQIRLLVKEMKYDVYWIIQRWEKRADSYIDP